MKANLITKMSVAMLLITTALISCTKDSSNLNDSRQPASSTNTGQGKALAVAEPALPVYYACGMRVNVWSPKINSPKQYSYAYKFNGSLYYFAIDGGPIRTNMPPDKFTFEFEGYLNDANTITSWRIRRIDGKYLTATSNSSLVYQDKLGGASAAKQIFLFGSLGDDTYQLIMPKMPVCRIANIAFNGDANLLYASPYDAPDLNNTKIIITPSSPSEIY